MCMNHILYIHIGLPPPPALTSFTFKMRKGHDWGYYMGGRGARRAKEREMAESGERRGGEGRGEGRGREVERGGGVLSLVSS
jgi:hypothetical protein